MLASSMYSNFKKKAAAILGRLLIKDHYFVYGPFASWYPVVKCCTMKSKCNLSLQISDILAVSMYSHFEKKAAAILGRLLININIDMDVRKEFKKVCNLIHFYIQSMVTLIGDLDILWWDASTRGLRLIHNWTWECKIVAQHVKFKLPHPKRATCASIKLGSEQQLGKN